MQENRRYTFCRKTDLIASYFCNGNRVLYEWVAVASRMLLESFGSYDVRLEDKLLARIVILKNTKKAEISNVLASDIG